jgi:hypothetical protein
MRAGRAYQGSETRNGEQAAALDLDLNHAFDLWQVLPNVLGVRVLDRGRGRRLRHGEIELLC